MIKANFCFVAHRGMHSKKQNIPENSIGAFKLAIQNRFSIHLEVQLSIDGIPMVFGDENLNRLCSINMKISDCEAIDASRLMLNGTDFKIPTLKSALEEINGQVPVMIEIIKDFDASEVIADKEDAYNPCKTIVEAVIKELEHYTGVVAIESRNPMAVLYLKNKYPKIHRGQIVEPESKNNGSNFFKKVLSRTQAFNFISNPNFISYDINELKESYANECHKKNLPILGYTATNEEQLKKANKLCDGVVFEEISITH